MAAQKPMKKPVSAKAAQAVANMLKNKGAKAAPQKTTPTKAAPMDAEDALDGGADEDQE